MSNDNFIKDGSKREGMIDNPYYMSKLVGEYIYKPEEDARKTSASVPRGQKFFARDDVILALSKIQLGYRPEFKQGQSVNINTNAFKTTLLNQMASQGGAIMNFGPGGGVADLTIENSTLSGNVASQGNSIAINSGYSTFCNNITSVYPNKKWWC